VKKDITTKRLIVSEWKRLKKNTILISSG